MPIIDPTPREWMPEDDGPCGLWPLNMDCCPGWPADTCEWGPEHLLAVEIATDMLWRLTGGQFGLCAELIRPCRESCVTDDWYQLGPGGGLLRPYVFGGRWFNAGCGCMPDGCSCGPLERIDLPGRVQEVVEVLVDGEALGEGSWRVLRRPHRAELVRTDGGAWPVCQDMTRPHTEPETFAVTYLEGRRVPAAGVRAVSTLACEIHKQCTGRACRLPDRVKTVQREGMTFEMYDPGEELERGLTGLREVDAWIRAVNPHKLTQPSAVFSLDLPAAPPAARGRWEW